MPCLIVPAPPNILEPTFPIALTMPALLGIRVVIPVLRAPPMPPRAPLKAVPTPGITRGKAIGATFLTTFLTALNTFL